MPDSNAVPPAEQGITPGDAAIVLPTYHKCLQCAELGRTCGGQKLAALGSIEAVRAYHRALKAARKIQLKQIYPAAPQIGHAFKPCIRMSCNSKNAQCIGSCTDYYVHILTFSSVLPAQKKWGLRPLSRFRDGKSPLIFVRNSRRSLFTLSSRESLLR